MNILKLIAQLTLDGKGFKAGIREAQSSAMGFAKGLQGQVAAAFGTGALVAFVKSSVDMANHIKDMSEQFNVTTREVQELDKVAREVGGGGFEAIGNGLLKLGQAREAASTNNDKLLATFNKYGVTLRDLQDPQLRNIDLMKKVAAAMDGLSETDRSDFAELFGKSGQKIIETLKAINAAGPIEVIKDDQIEKLDQSIEKLEEVKRRMKVRAVGPLTDVLNVSDSVFSGKDADTSEMGSLGKFLNAGLNYVPSIGMLIKRFNRANRETPGINPAQDYGGAVGEPKAPAAVPPEMTPETRADYLKKLQDAERDVVEASMKFRLGGAKSEYERRLQLEKQLQDKAREHASKKSAADFLASDDAKELGIFSEKGAFENLLGAKGDEKDMFSLLAQFEKSTGKIDIAELTKTGQLGGGRNAVAEQRESQVVAQIKQLLGITTRGVVAQEETARAVKDSPPIRVQR